MTASQLIRWAAGMPISLSSIRMPPEKTMTPAALCTTPIKVRERFSRSSAVPRLVRRANSSVSRRSMRRKIQMTAASERTMKPIR